MTWLWCVHTTEPLESDRHSSMASEESLTLSTRQVESHRLAAVLHRGGSFPFEPRAARALCFTVSTSTSACPHVGASRGAKPHAKSAVTKQQTKSSKPRGKGSALQEATEVASKAVTSSGDAPADTGASSRRSRLPSLPKDDGSNPRFAVREHSPGTVAEARAEHNGSHSEEAAGERTPLPSEGGRESVHSLGSDHGGHSPMSPSDKALDSSNNRSDEGEKPRRFLRNLSLSEGRERAQATKAAAEQSKHTKKRNASRSPRREALETEVDPYKDFFDSDSEEEEEEGAVNEPQEISNDLDRQQEDFQAAH
ncbi:hypothetical protein PC128_g18308 [Phytophthora cactorum]|nr:hypothetical protein PC120_g16017 [Phytophthora cactorum]KAG3074043.1 hypothetical protein PC121_g8462 [Phytophthora cactorum]KAG3173340.1 hypothetical protein PC128_g18308 [Phytophthora cactorum]